MCVYVCLNVYIYVSFFPEKLAFQTFPIIPIFILNFNSKENTYQKNFLGRDRFPGSFSNYIFGDSLLYKCMQIQISFRQYNNRTLSSFTSLT